MLKHCPKVTSRSHPIIPVATDIASVTYNDVAEFHIQILHIVGWKEGCQR